MQGFWLVTIKYVNIRIIYTLNKVVHSRTWSHIIVTDRYKCKKKKIRKAEFCGRKKNVIEVRTRVTGVTHRRHRH